MTTKPMLIEILTEELPAVPFQKELPNIKKKWQEILDRYSFETNFEFFYTPRRLILLHKQMPIKQCDKTKELVGAPISIAYKDGKPTNACISFAKKCGVQTDKLSTKTINSQEVLYFKKNTIGKETKELLEDMINQFLKNLNFGKAMRWASCEKSFIRPIRGLVAMIGDEDIKVSAFGVNSSKKTNIHRSISYDKIGFATIEEYFEVLKNNGVVFDQTQREYTIIKQIEDISKKQDIDVDIDKQLLSEIVAMCEYPTVLCGNFDKKFLNLPKEVIINSMKEHQRYFACFKQNKITNRFIVVSNAYTDDMSLVQRGNEKVLRPRLEDAMFFYQNDIKDGLDSQKLKNIKFADSLGTVYDKMLREQKIALLFNNDPNLIEAIVLSKADLVSDMVVEFPKLQGLMGYYYAKKMNKDDKICQAIKEQYMPTSDTAPLPNSLFGAIVAICSRFDTILSMFSIDKIPTGSKDPYGLRRAVVAIVRICLKFDIKFDIINLIDSLSPNYKKIDKDMIVEFFYERFYKIYKDINPSVIKAVLGGQSGDIVDFDKKLKALDMAVSQKEFEVNFKTFKRVANIVDETVKDINIDEAMLVDKTEITLVSKLKTIQQNNTNSFENKLSKLFALKSDIDNFFDKVKINCDDIKLKQNRQKIINNIYQEFKKIADIKLITI